MDEHRTTLDSTSSKNVAASQPFNEGDRRRRRARNALTAKISNHDDEGGTPRLAPPILHPQPDPEG